MLSSLFCKQSLLHILRNRKLLINEKMKMSKGLMYNASFDCKLFWERLQCKKLCHYYNNISPEKIRARNQVISKILGKVGDVFLIEQPFMCDYGYNIEIGENFCSNHNFLILDSAKVVFGDNVMVGPNCGFYTTTHPLNPEVRRAGLQSAKPIVVGDNAWICANVIVLGGVTIGENSVIGAGSVVTKDIPPFSLAVGNPCRIVKNLQLL